MSRLPVLSLWLAASSAILFIALGPASEFLVYQRDAVQAGELSRLISAHFVHSDKAHLAWNLMALILLGGLLEHREGVGRLLIFLLAGFISVGLYIIWQSQLTAYCGLSGVLNTLLAGVLHSLFREPSTRQLSLWVGSAALAKILIEVAGNGALFTHTAWPSVPMAHLWGFAGGILYSIFFHFFKRERKQYRVKA